MMLVILLFSLYIFHYDILSPSVIVCSAYVLSILSAIINIDSWGVSLNYNTFYVIVGGMLLFMSVNLIIEYYHKHNDHPFVSTIFKIISIQKYKTIIVCALQIIVAFVYAKEVRKISSQYGSFNDFSSMMNIFRNTVSYGNQASIPTIVNQFVKVSFVSALIYEYVIINNLVAGLKTNKMKIYFFPIIIYVFQSILTGARSNLLILAGAAAIYFNVQWHRKYGWYAMINFKTILKVIAGIILLFCGFYISKSLVGRFDNSDIITYMTTYTGGSIQLLDMYLENPINNSGIWGKETFYGLIDLIQKLGLTKTSEYIKHLEFRKSNGVIIGNVYTAYRLYINDFGIIGMIILQTIFAFIYCYIYKKIKNKIINKQVDYLLLVYGLLAYALFIHSINDNFFSSVFSLNYMTLFILLKIISYLLIEKKIIIK